MRTLASSSTTDHSAIAHYRDQPIDASIPPVRVSRLLTLPSHRPGRKSRSTPLDPYPNLHYGDPIIQKKHNTIRLYFQNVKGLTYSTSREDYNYYMSCLRAYDVDIAGLSETNTCWAHPHLSNELKGSVRRHYRQSKVTFGSPTREIDPCSPTETFQAGGNLTLVTGHLVSTIDGAVDLSDTTGLGRWSGVTLSGRNGLRLSIITAYRVCSGTPRTAPLGSALVREYEYLRSQPQTPIITPRQSILNDLSSLMSRLQDLGHMIILMLDANSTIDTDQRFESFLSAHGLKDFHQYDPPPSTYIGSASRRIDYIFGSDNLLDFLARSGSLAYTEGPQSDHRGLYIDLQMDELTQSTVDKMAPSSLRSLHTGNPEHVKKYHDSMMKYYGQHQMVDRIESLAETHWTMTREDVRRLLTGWDNDQGRAMATSEKQLSRPPQKYRWSPILRNAAIIRRYWKLRLREQTHPHSDYSSSFIRWQEQVQVYDPTFVLPHLGQPLSLEAIRESFNSATRSFRRYQKQSVPLRFKAYEDLLEIYEDDTDPGTKAESRRKAKIVRRTLASETCRGVFRNIRQAVKPSETSSLSKLLIPRPSNSDTVDTTNAYDLLQTTDPDDVIWDTIIDRDDLERHTLNYNQTSFRAAAESPCGHGVIHDSIKFSSLSPASRDLLAGTIPPDWGSDDTSLREFLASFTTPDIVSQTDPIPFAISAEDAIKGFQKWPEATSTSPSGRHLGHYKSIIQHPILLHCMVSFMNIAIARGIAIPRWCNATNVMIEKDPGRPRINRLRIIHLFEADFNFFLKLQWGHRLVRRAWELDILHPGQHGSVPQRTAIDPIMLTHLTSDLCRVLKHDYARFDNDASACYDRIIVALGMLAARRCGMPECAIQTHAEALQFMKYTVKTVHGVSESNYQGTAFEPLFGTGQGSGASPAVWLTLVVILLNTLDRLIPDRIIFHPIEHGRMHRRLVDAFVDDTSLGLTSPGTYTYNELIDRLTTVAQTWEHLLHLSGGKLNLSKCSWFVMYWEWEHGRPRLRETTPLDRGVCLSQGSSMDGIKLPIRRTSLGESTKMLGVYLNPMGDFGHHLTVLKKKADMYASRLQSSRLTASDIRTFHRSIYIPSMRYSLSVLAINEEELGQIQARILRVMLQRMHVHGNLPTSIRHGPMEFGGLGMYDLRTEAGIESLKYLRNAIYSDSEPGNLIRLNIQYSQLEAGIGEPLLLYPSIPVSYLTPTWILSVRQFLTNHNMSLRLTNEFTVPLRGSTDGYIMQEQHLTRYSPSQQRDINLVRLYLQVTTLSDISDPVRHSAILLSALDGERSQAWINNEL